MSFAGKTVLVTGGSGGIGREVCRRFAAKGARVWVHYGGREAEAERTLEAIRSDGHRGDHRKVATDLEDPEAVAAMVDRVVADGGALDILVNNAGVFERHRLDEVTYEAWQHHWRRTLGINLVGAANACYCAGRHMIDRGEGGRIINISSRGAFRGEPENPAYGASKAGLNALTQSLALHLGPHGIGVYAVAPGFVETAMARPYLTSEMADSIRAQSPLGRVARVGDVAYWVLCLADDDAEFATGAIVDVNGASYLRT
ncbi:MAG: SDR family NAD(P)-dependent oxidoreductase [Acidobacteriota bacterium]